MTASGAMTTISIPHLACLPHPLLPLQSLGQRQQRRQLPTVSRLRLCQRPPGSPVTKLPRPPGTAIHTQGRTRQRRPWPQQLGPEPRRSKLPKPGGKWRRPQTMPITQGSTTLQTESTHSLLVSHFANIHLDEDF